MDADGHLGNACTCIPTFTLSWHLALGKLSSRGYLKFSAADNSSAMSNNTPANSASSNASEIEGTDLLNLYGFIDKQK